MATVLRFAPPAPAVAPKERRSRGPRCLKPSDIATSEYARRVAAFAKGLPRPYRRLTAQEAHGVALRLIQLTAGRLYRPDHLDLLSLTEHLSLAAEREGR